MTPALCGPFDNPLGPQPRPELLTPRGAFHESAQLVAVLDDASGSGALSLGLDDSEGQMQLCASARTGHASDEGELRLFNLTQVLALALSASAAAAITALVSLRHLREAPKAPQLLALFQAFAVPGVIDELYAHLFIAAHAASSTEPTPSLDTLASVAYGAYTAGPNHNNGGQALPAWDGLSAACQAAWMEAVRRTEDARQGRTL